MKTSFLMHKVEILKTNQILSLSIFFFASLIPFLVIGQPTPCDIENPEMTSTCADACIICDVDGFTGRHESDIVGVLPGDFCTMFVHNAQWIAFQAASTSLKVKLSVSNCVQGYGLELAIYKSSDCTNFTMISNCRGSGSAVNDGSSAEFETTEDLVIGQYYYLAMDGSHGDNCDWTFEVLEGSTEVAPLTVTSPIEGIDRFCTSTIQNYTTTPELGAVFFEWTLNGQSIGDTRFPSVDLSIDNPGIYELCVTASNACDEAETTCRQIEVYSIPITYFADEFCANDCYEIDGNVFCETGLYEYSITLADGCDSTIIADLTELMQPINNIAINICEGDTIYIGTVPYFSNGTHSETLLSDVLCDSIVNLDLAVIVCNIQTSYFSTSNICFGDANGSATFSIENGTAPFSFNWQHLQNNLTGFGSEISLGQSVTIPDLPFGTVVIEINDDFGNFDVLLVQIDEPLLIEIEESVSEFNSYNVSCFGSSDGAISLLTTGGQSPYSYSWSTGNDSPTVNNLVGGIYTATLTDNLGCESINEYNLIEPDEITADVLFVDPNCNGLETGIVDVTSISGGAAPYLYSIDADDLSDIGNFSQLPPDEYFLTIVDANMCTYEESQELFAPQIPSLTGETDYSTQLGCELVLNVEVNNIDILDVVWLDDSYLDCSDCLETTSIPLNSGTNTIIVTSIDECADSLLINIEVEKSREFFAPNIFSPNEDYNNDRFSLTGGKEVERIELKVFDRWGSPVFEDLDMNPVDEFNGWDGTMNSTISDVGVYVWVANIFFIDGVSETQSGDVTLVR